MRGAAVRDTDRVPMIVQSAGTTLTWLTILVKEKLKPLCSCVPPDRNPRDF